MEDLVLYIPSDEGLERDCPCFYTLKQSVTKIGRKMTRLQTCPVYIFGNKYQGFALIHGQIYNPEWGRWIIWDKPGTWKHPFRTWQFFEFVACLGWWVKTWPPNRGSRWVTLNRLEMFVSIGWFRTSTWEEVGNHHCHPIQKAAWKFQPLRLLISIFHERP